MNNILKQLQEKGEAELDKEFGYLYNYEVKDEYCAKDFDYEKLKVFINQQTTLAFEAGKVEAIAMVLKEIEGMKYKGEDTPFGFNPLEHSPIFANERAVNRALDTLKTKLQTKE